MKKIFIEYRKNLIGAIIGAAVMLTGTLVTGLLDHIKLPYVNRNINIKQEKKITEIKIESSLGIKENRKDILNNKSKIEKKTDYSYVNSKQDKLVTKEQFNQALDMIKELYRSQLKVDNLRNYNDFDIPKIEKKLKYLDIVNYEKKVDDRKFRLESN